MYYIYWSFVVPDACLKKKKKERKPLESAVHSIAFHTCAPLLHKTAPRFPPQGDLGAHLEALTSLPAGFIAKAICDDWRIGVVMVFCWVFFVLFLCWEGHQVYSSSQRTFVTS